MGDMFFLYALLIIFSCVLGHVYIYVPTPYDSEVTQVMAVLLADNSGVPFLAVGDFNALCNPNMDKYPGGTLRNLFLPTVHGNRPQRYLEIA